MSETDALAAAYAQLSKPTADSLRTMQNQAQTKAQWSDLSKKDLKAGSLFLSAYSLDNVAHVEPSAINWAAAGDRYSQAFQMATDSSLKPFVINKAMECYRNAIGKDSSNIKNYVKLAACFTDGTGDVMSGVLLLRSVEKRDSTDSDLNLMLGRLDVVSGQYDKAVKRLSRLTLRDPQNTEAWLHLGEAYRALGQKDKAVESLMKCRATVSDPAVRQQVDNIIKQIKNS